MIKDLKKSLEKINVNDFVDLECYKESRLRIEDEMAREQTRCESDLLDGLDTAREHTYSEVAIFKEAECNWLVLDTVDCSIELKGVSETLPDEIKEDDINIDVKTIKD